MLSFLVRHLWIKKCLSLSGRNRRGFKRCVRDILPRVGDLSPPGKLAKKFVIVIIVIIVLVIITP